jgi:Flp pilus assembly pilin Flp
MLRRLSLRGKHGLSVFEYSILIAVLALALLAMQNYLRRAISQKWRDAGDSFGVGRQYEPGVTTLH